MINGYAAQLMNSHNELTYKLVLLMFCRYGMHCHNGRLLLSLPFTSMSVVLITVSK